MRARTAALCALLFALAACGTLNPPDPASRFSAYGEPMAAREHPSHVASPGHDPSATEGRPADPWLGAPEVR